ncbi:MAG TPA: IS1595 family transposase [Candidatus Angelobacter sp.]|nr:IS1595 family transposase [Candidatus Angelobacter sp.]
MTLPELNRMYSTDQRCRELLKKLRWPLGTECLRCKSKKVCELATQKKFECMECGYQFSVLTGTIFHDTHLPIETWFMAVLLLIEARKGISANQVKRTLGISYKTAWYLNHRIRAAMKITDKPMLSGKVEMDETYVGGKPPKGSKRGRGTPKEVVLAIRERGGELRFFHAEDVKSGTLEKYIKENISEDVDVFMTDDFSSYPPALKKSKLKDKHQSINHSMGVYAIGDLHTNTAESAFSLLKRGIIGTWHKLSAKHLHAYLTEMEFRFNRRSHDEIFIETLRYMVTADPLKYAELISEPDDFEKASA